MVLADIDVLDTLTPRDFLAGYGEVVKYGLLGNEAFFEWLEEHGPALANGDKEARAEAVRISCQMKADIVERDETEQGDRALLNLGHTFCHALEAATGILIAYCMAKGWPLAARWPLICLRAWDYVRKRPQAVSPNTSARWA